MNVVRDPITRDELVDLFWKSDAPQALANFANAYVLNFYRELPALPVSYRPDPDELLDLSTTQPERVTFMLDGQPYGDMIYIAVISGLHVIVPPFPLHMREQLPTLRPV